MRGTKSADGKQVGGSKRLTDKIIDKMQNHFEEAIRKNSGNLEAMRRAVWAVLKHMVRNDTETLEEQHDYCPKDGWCNSWESRDNYDDGKRLPAVIYDLLEPIFQRLSKNDLLNRCLRGMTQNQNESINGVLWGRCPKTKFCGRQKVELAVSETVCEFNTGAYSKVFLQIDCGSNVSSNIIASASLQYKLRINKAAVKILDQARLTRRKAKAKKKSKNNKDNCNSYMAGGFGTSKTPEVLSVQPIQKTRTTFSKKKVTPKFIDERYIKMVIYSVNNAVN